MMSDHFKAFCTVRCIYCGHESVELGRLETNLNSRIVKQHYVCPKCGKHFSGLYGLIFSGYLDALGEVLAPVDDLTVSAPVRAVEKVIDVLESGT